MLFELFVGSYDTNHSYHCWLYDELEVETILLELSLELNRDLNNRSVEVNVRTFSHINQKFDFFVNYLSYQIYF